MSSPRSGCFCGYGLRDQTATNMARLQVLRPHAQSDEAEKERHHGDGALELVTQLRLKPSQPVEEPWGTRCGRRRPLSS